MSGNFGRKRIYLMRHGHVDYFDPEITDPRMVKLTDQGEEQAGAASVALQQIDFDIAISSGLPRTQRTAEIVLAGRDEEPAITPVPGIEELKSGWIKATTREELAARLAYSFDNAEAEGARFMEDGELFSEAQARITGSLEDLILNESWKSALVVAHEGVNRIVLGWASGGGLATIAAFEQDLCCINVLDVDVTPKENGPGAQIERILIKAVNVTPYDYIKNGLSRSSLEHLFDVDFGMSRPPLRKINTA